MSKLVSDAALSAQLEVQQGSLFTPAALREFRLNPQRKQKLHPERVKELLRAKVERRRLRTDGQVRGLHDDWRVMLYTKKAENGFRTKRTLRSRSYEEACLVRDEEMESGDYEFAWICGLGERRK